MTPEEIAELWVRADPALESAEKETTIRWAKPDEEAKIHTDERGPGRRLIKHPDSTVEEVSVLRDDGDTYDALEPERVEDDDEVVGVRLRLPIGALKVRRTPRDTAQHAAVVSNRAEADGGRFTLPSVGDRVADREDGDELVVVDVHPAATAAEHPATDDTVVADHNDGYDPAAPVVDAVYLDEVVLAEWRDTEGLHRSVDVEDLTTYSFPADRLGPVEEAAQ